MAADLDIALGWIPSRGWTIAGWTMLHFLWIGAAIGLLAATVRILLRRTGPQVRYAVALAFFALTAAAPVMVAVRVSQSLEASPANPDRPAALPRNGPPLSSWEPQVESRAADQPPFAPGGDRVQAGHEEHAPAATALLPARPDVPPAAAGGIRPDSQSLTLHEVIDRTVRIFPALWITGSSLLLATTLAGLHGAARLRRHSRRLLGGEIIDRCSSLARSLRIARKVSVAVCDRLAGPVLVGVVRPCILLPPAALTGWTPQQVEMVLLHELSHIRRWDNLVNLVQRLVESVLFFQPAVWWISGWIRLEREHCCDEAVVRRTGRRREYAETLLLLSDAALHSERDLAEARNPRGASSMARSHLVPRIRRLLQKGPEPMQTSRAAIVLVMTCLVAVVVLPLSMNRAGTRADESQPESAASARRSSDGPAERSERPPDASQPDQEALLPDIRSDGLEALSASTASGLSPEAANGDPAQPATKADTEWPITVSNAYVTPGQSVTVAARREGVLKTVAVSEGETVKKGQVLASLPDDPLRIVGIEVRYGESALKGALLTLESAEASNKAARRAVSEIKVRQLRLDSERARLQLDRSQAEYESLKDSLIIRAPIDGIVARVHRAAGESVKAGEPLADLVNTEHMQVEGEVDYRRMWMLRPGAPVEVRVHIPEIDLPVERDTFKGELTFVNNAIEPVSRAVRVRARVHNTRGLLKAGLTVKMSIHKPDGENAPDQNPADENSAAVRRDRL